MKAVDFLKLGGSVLTNKDVPLSVNTEQLTTAAKTIAQHIKTMDRGLIIGTGAGSFGHYYASKLPHTDGVYDDQAAATIHASVQTLNALFTDALVAEGVRVMSLPANEFVAYKNGALKATNGAVKDLLEAGTVVCVYGDMVPSDSGWMVASTEQLFLQLAEELSANFTLQNCLLASDTPGVLDGTGELILTLDNSDIINHKNADYDVTGGMHSKVTHALALSNYFKVVRIIDGRTEPTLTAALAGEKTGTRVVPKSPATS